MWRCIQFEQKHPEKVDDRTWLTISFLNHETENQGLFANHFTFTFTAPNNEHHDTKKNNFEALHHTRIVFCILYCRTCTLELATSHDQRSWCRDRRNTIASSSSRRFTWFSRYPDRNERSRSFDDLHGTSVVLRMIVTGLFSLPCLSRLAADLATPRWEPKRTLAHGSVPYAATKRLSYASA